MQYSQVLQQYKSSYNTVDYKQLNVKNRKLVDILSDSELCMTHSNLWSNNHNLVNSEKVSTKIVESYFTDSNTIMNDIQKVESSDWCNWNGSIFISSPIYKHSSNKVSIQMYYYVSNSGNDLLSNESLENLSTILSVVFEKKVNLELTRMKYPYMNAEILAKYLVSEVSSGVKFQRVWKKLEKQVPLHIYGVGKVGEKGSVILPSYISNIRVEVSGRLKNEKVIPRVTDKSAILQKPNAVSSQFLNSKNLSMSSVKSTVVDYGKHTYKNDLGAFTMKVWITSFVMLEK